MDQTQKSPWEQMAIKAQQAQGANTQVSPEQQQAMADRLKGFKGLK